MQPPSDAGDRADAGGDEAPVSAIGAGPTPGGRCDGADPGSLYGRYAEIRPHGRACKRFRIRELRRADDRVHQQRRPRMAHCCRQPERPRSAESQRRHSEHAERRQTDQDRPIDDEGARRKHPHLTGRYLRRARHKGRQRKLVGARRKGDPSHDADQPQTTRPCRQRRPRRLPTIGRSGGPRDSILTSVHPMHATASRSVPAQCVRRGTKAPGLA